MENKMIYLNETYASDIITKMEEWKRIETEMIDESKRNFDLIMKIFYYITEKTMGPIISIDIDAAINDDDRIYKIEIDKNKPDFRKMGENINIFSKSDRSVAPQRLSLNYIFDKQKDYIKIGAVLDALIGSYPDIIKKIEIETNTKKFDL